MQLKNFELTVCTDVASEKQQPIKECVSDQSATNFRDRGWSLVSERSETPIAYLSEQMQTWKDEVPLIAYEKHGLLPEETARVSVHIKTYGPYICLTQHRFKQCLVATTL